MTAPSGATWSSVVTTAVCPREVSQGTRWSSKAPAWNLSGWRMKPTRLMSCAFEQYHGGPTGLSSRPDEPPQEAPRGPLRPPCLTCSHRTCRRSAFPGGNPHEDDAEEPLAHQG